MKKNTIFSALLILIFAATLLTSVQTNLIAGDRYKDKPYFKDIEKLKLYKKSGIFNLNVDIQLGATIANTSFEFNQPDTSTNKLTSTQSKVGPAAGVILSVDFLGFGFTTGLLYASKGFKQQDNTNFNLNYFNIPLLFYFDFQISKVIIDGNLGPYFGILMSTDNSPIYKIKNFDLGVTGNVQGAYMLNKYIGPLLGVKFEYGGLNNLVSTDQIKSVRTSTFFIYTGVKFVL